MGRGGGEICSHHGRENKKSVQSKVKREEQIGHGTHPETAHKQAAAFIYVGCGLWLWVMGGETLRPATEVEMPVPAHHCARWPGS